MIKYRTGVNVIHMLSNVGYNTGEIRRRKILGESTLQKIRDGKLPSWNELNKLCNLLGVHPVDLLEYIPDESQGRTKSDLPAE